MEPDGDGVGERTDGPHHPCFAALYDPVGRLTERRVGRYRAALVRDITGSVLDVGAGTGAMFPYLCARRDAIEIHAIEPDPAMRRRAVRRAAELDCRVDLRAAPAEALPFPDGSIDVALLVFVACTVPDLEGALDELARVIAPTGEVRFLEHVRADGLRGRIQDGLAPLWHRVAGGCRLNRSTLDVVEDHPGVVLDRVERIDVGVYPLSPVVRGRIVPASRSEIPSTTAK